MKTSELINILKEVQSKHGDLPANFQIALINKKGKIKLIEVEPYPLVNIKDKILRLSITFLHK